MDDRFLHEQRRDPDPAFARELRARLEELDAARPPRAPAHRAALVAAAAALAVVAALVVSPGLRLRAQAALDLFRVRDFAVVPVDEARLRQLRERRFDPATLFVSETGAKPEAQPARGFATLEQAVAAAGFTPLRAGLLPRGLAADSAWVHPGGHMSGRVDTRALRDLMDAFDVRDLEVPAGLDGQTLAIEMPVMLAQRFRSGGRARAMLMQCASPEVSLPRGVDPARLGEIGLRLAGLSRTEAHRLAGTIDWRSTLVVPVLSNATSFQQVTVNGDRGLCVETTRAAGPDGPAGPGVAVVWSHAGRVVALSGNLGRVDLMEMAESVR